MNKEPSPLSGVKNEPDRGYQKGFFRNHPGVGEESGRLRKAEKIRYALEKQKFPLETAIALDIGCSSGIVTCAISDLFASIIGIEYDKEALEYRPKHNCPVGFINGDAMLLPVADSCIDLVICAQVYEHVPSDRQLFLEIYRILKPNGIVFFSGPNWLFPIEPHYFLPFLHWFPEAISDAYLRLFKMGNHYYERSRTIWGLRKLFRKFEILDLSIDVLLWESSRSKNLLMRAFHLIPPWLFKLLLPIIPNYNWILKKPLN